MTGIRAAEIETVYTGNVLGLERASNRANELILKNQTAIINFQKTLDRVNSQPLPDFGAKGAQAASRQYRELNSELSALSPTFARFGGSGAAAGIGALAAGFYSAAKAGIEYKGMLDRTTRSFEGMLGSQQAALQHLKELQSFANTTPFEFEEVTRASQRFVAMGMSAKDTIPYLTAIGNAVAKVGGGKEQIDSVSLAIAQVSARGKVSAQEMNQLANALVDGWKPLEAELGKTRGELFKMAEQGEISAETFLRAFRKAHEGGNAMAKQMETLSGASSTLKDYVNQMNAGGFTPLYNVLKDITVELAKMSTAGFDAQRGLLAAASAAKDAFEAINPGAAGYGAESLGFLFGGLPGAQAVAAARAAQMGLPQGAQKFGAGKQQGPGAWFNQPIRVPEALQYDGSKADAAVKAAMERQQEEMRRKAEQTARDLAKPIEQMKDFAKEWGFIVTSTIGGRHNKGSAHYSGRAMDVSVRGKSDAEVRAFMEAARQSGYGVRDERVRPAGQKVWSGPHLHLEGLNKAAQAVNKELEGQNDILNQLALKMAEADLAVQAFSRTTVEQEMASARMNLGLQKLDGPAAELAETMMVNYEATLKAREAAKRHAEAVESLKGIVASTSEEVFGEARAIDRVTAALIKAEVPLGSYEGWWARLVATMKDAGNTLEGLIPVLGVEVKVPEGPWVNPADVSDAPANVFEDIARRQREMREVGEDMADIFSNVFRSVEDGWRGMWNEMLNISRSVLQDITRELMRAMLTGQKSGAGGIIGMAANWLGGALLGGLGGALPHGTAFSGAGGAGAFLQPSSFVGGFADGGFIPPGKWGMTGERGPEPIFGGRTGVTVAPNSTLGSQAVVNNYNFNLTVKDTPASYTRKKTPNQVASTLLRGLRGR